MKLTYNLWSDEDIKRIRSGMSKMSPEAKEVAEKILEVIDVANQRHNEEMTAKEADCLQRISESKTEVMICGEK